MSKNFLDVDVCSSLNSAAVIREYKKIISNRKTNILLSGGLGIGTKSTVNRQDVSDTSLENDTEVYQGLVEQEQCMGERNNNSLYPVNSDLAKHDSLYNAHSSPGTVEASNTEEHFEFNEERTENPDVSCPNNNLKSQIVKNDLPGRNGFEETVEDVKQKTKEPEEKGKQCTIFICNCNSYK
ncbi:unnamed protein product [Mytilus coruscus]|uniref:Uncharacterized protein n=1 Tax=Mytilus coruscus TaxID=42192 RepID=A0A6J8AHJ1_MYTCO|nr:unnamed protein product [Mytilus coruscus]